MALTAGPGKGGSSRSILSDRVKLQLPVTCTYCNEPARCRQQTQLPHDLQAGPVGRQGHGTVPPPQDYCSRAHLGGLTLTDFPPIFCSLYRVQIRGMGALHLNRYSGLFALRFFFSPLWGLLSFCSPKQRLENVGKRLQGGHVQASKTLLSLLVGRKMQVCLPLPGSPRKDGIKGSNDSSRVAAQTKETVPSPPTLTRQHSMGQGFRSAFPTETSE